MRTDGWIESDNEAMVAHLKSMGMSLAAEQLRTRNTEQGTRRV